MAGIARQTSEDTVSLSPTLCATFRPEDYPKSIAKATAAFAWYGDLARVDMTLGHATGRILVTYYDIRCAQCVQADFQGADVAFAPPLAQDFRSVAIPRQVVAGLSSGLQEFGEISRVTPTGENVVVEFYDMRAAQLVTFHVTGAQPQYQHAHAQLAPTPLSELSCVPRDLPETVALPPGLEPVTEKNPFCVPPNLFTPVSSDDSGVPACTGGTGSPMPSKGAEKLWPLANAGSGKPNRDKVAEKDLSRFDILPEEIKQGKDTRSTVMVRNIPKTCGREAFIDFLGSCGLTERYSFFYMPFDKRRNTHCGFAFVNFNSPFDVLTLFESVQMAGSKTHMAALAVNYARLQGQEQLIKHFSLSAVLHENDARKRPVFYASTDGEVFQQPQKAKHREGRRGGKLVWGTPTTRSASLQTVHGSAAA
jgi:hypothetical protein